jgi:hypothetical protein
MWEETLFFVDSSSQISKNIFQFCVETKRPSNTLHARTILYAILNLLLFSLPLALLPTLEMTLLVAE